MVDDIDKYDTIIEPFSDSFAIKFNVWLKYHNKKFISNGNNDDLMKVYNLIKMRKLKPFKTE
jgi:site-specific DNA-adenine methylase